MLNITIRRAEKVDLRAILKIVNHEILHSTVVYNYEERTFEQQLDWFSKKQDDGMPVIVAESGGEVVGFGTYGIFRPWEAYKFSVEHSIYVDSDHREGGIGKMIMAKLIELARTEGYHTMIAGVDASNTGSVAFHKKFGFVEVGTFKEVGYKFNTWLDLLFLQLFLKEKDHLTSVS